MRELLGFLKDYFRQTSVFSLVLTMSWTAIWVVLNYSLDIESLLHGLPSRPLSLICFFVLYATIFGIAFLIQLAFTKGNRLTTPAGFWALLLICPWLFAIKMIPWSLIGPMTQGWQQYLQIIVLWPAKLLMLLLAGWILKKLFGYAHPLWGNKPHWRELRLCVPLVLISVPLVYLASTTPSFLAAYPKLHMVTGFARQQTHPWIWKALFELSYGLDFLSIEFFFRGLLIFGFLRYAGSKTILPMAAFYCAIHFGKPLAECITSFFGGLALGVLSWRSRSIAAGIIVHLAIAYAMEWFGWLEHLG